MSNLRDERVTREVEKWLARPQRHLSYERCDWLSEVHAHNRAEDYDGDQATTRDIRHERNDQFDCNAHSSVRSYQISRQSVPNCQSSPIYIHFVQISILGYSMTVFHIQIISDPVCPWCYIGYRRFAKARELYQKTYPSGSKDTFNVEWKPYYLNPDAPLESVLIQGTVVPLRTSPQEVC